MGLAAWEWLFSGALILWLNLELPYLFSEEDKFPAIQVTVNIQSDAGIYLRKKVNDKYFF